MKLTKEILERLILEELEEEPEPEAEDEIDYSEDYEDALTKIEDCEKRVEYLTKRLDKSRDREKSGKYHDPEAYKGWTSLWEEK